MKKLFLILLTLVSVAQAQTNIVSVEYWVDADPGFGYGIPISINPQQDVNQQYPLIANLSTGMHTLGIRSKDSNNVWSHTNIFPIYVADSSNGFVSKIEYFWDTDPGFGYATDTVLNPALADLNNGILIANVPMLGLGEHILFARTLDNRGRWSHTNSVDSVLVNGTVNVTDFEKVSNVKVFPNPFMQKVVITPGMDEKVRMIIFDESGKKVIDGFIEKEITLNTESLASGIYSLFIWKGNNTIYRTSILKQ